ncbi:MAG: mannose-1-phosphate guanylyltransferase/mannose-6-phosphate isomerase [bacterium]
MSAILPVVLAGGAGTRLWPLSRALLPKQFLRLTGARSLLQQTLSRLDGLDARAPCIVCNESHRFMAAAQCDEIERRCSVILLERAPRGTAPAVALAACHALAGGGDPALLVLPADHHIARADAFRDAVRAGVGLIESGALLTFGVPPARAERGYGYIRADADADAGEAGGARRIVEFVEKPSRADAQAYFESGAFHWNSGIFLFKASAYLDELSRHQPAIVQCCRAAIDSGAADLGFFRPGDAFAESPSDSIDCAVMERTDRALMLELDAGWSDIGSWRALREATRRGPERNAGIGGNAIIGDVIAVDTSDSLIHAEHRLVATLGVDNLVVVETADAVLVAAESEAARVGEIVKQIKALSRSEHHLHRRVHRPWGAYETVDAAPGYLVKRITVAPRARLSMQRHRHRSEHWIVVEGVARVHCDGVDSTLRANESTYIPPGRKHRLHNPGERPLELIEVQVGAHLSEDDIERFDDDYGRDEHNQNEHNQNEHDRDEHKRDD